MKQKSIFQIFKFGKNRISKQLYNPSDKKTWAIHMASEFIGTLILSILLAGLAIILPNNKPVVVYFHHQIIVGIYGFFVILLLLMVFVRWSCDLNPAITFFRIINGTNSYKYGFSKIFIQFLAAIGAGIIIWFITSNSIGTAIDATKNSPGIFRLGSLSNSTSTNLPKTAAFFWDLFVESFMIVMALWAIFSKGINDRYRDLIVPFTFACAIVAGQISGNSVAINPARGIAQQVPAILSGDFNHQGILITTIAILFSGIVAPCLYALLQGYTIRFGNNILLSAVVFIPTCFKFQKNKKHNLKSTRNINSKKVDKYDI